jgi:hypothetical protein
LLIELTDILRVDAVQSLEVLRQGRVLLHPAVILNVRVVRMKERIESKQELVLREASDVVADSCQGKSDVRMTELGTRSWDVLFDLGEYENCDGGVKEGNLRSVRNGQQ